MPRSLGVEGIWYNFTFATLISNIVHVALIVRVCTCAWHSHGLSFEIFSIKAFRVLLSSDISYLLSKEAFVSRSMSSIIVRAPEFEVRVICSRFIDVFASRFMKSSEVQCDHDVITSFSFGWSLDITTFTFLVFRAVVIRAVDDELLSSALWLNDDVIDEDWGIRHLQLSPSLSLVP